MQIKDLSIFHNLDDTEFKKSLVCTQSVIHEYKKNDYIFFQGDAPSMLMVKFFVLPTFPKGKILAKLNFFLIKTAIADMQKQKLK